MGKNVLFALVAWCASTAVQAQGPPPLSSQPQRTPAVAEAAFTFERLHTRVRFENDGSGRREQTLWIKILDEQAVRQFGEFPLVYQSDSEDLALTAVSVLKPDGTVVPTPAASVQDLATMPPGQLPIYGDVRQKVASVTALRPGLAAQALRATTLPLLFPTDTPVRIPLGLRVACRTAKCLGAIEFPRRVKLPDAAAPSER